MMSMIAIELMIYNQPPDHYNIDPIVMYEDMVMMIIMTRNQDELTHSFHHLYHKTYAMSIDHYNLQRVRQLPLYGSAPKLSFKVRILGHARAINDKLRRSNRE
jgi:hypothetical protein